MEAPEWFQEWIRHSTEIQTGIATETYRSLKRLIDERVKYPGPEYSDKMDSLRLNALVDCIWKCCRAKKSCQILEMYYQLMEERVEKFKSYQEQLESHLASVDIGERLDRRRKYNK